MTRAGGSAAAAGGNVSFQKTLSGLSKKVLLPMVLGQLLRLTPALKLYTSNKKAAKRVSEAVLLSIVWNSFSNAFLAGVPLTLSALATLITITGGLHVGYFLLSLRFLPAPSRSHSAAAAFVASHKTLAFGLPLMRSVFGGRPDLAMVVAPLMVVHPLQLFLGGAVGPRVERWIEEGEEGK